MERDKRLKDRDTGTVTKTETETETLQKEPPRAVAGDGMGA